MVIDLTVPCRPWLGATIGEARRGFTSKGPRGAQKRTYIYRQVVGEIPPGYVIDHLCQNPNCWEPAHLEAVTSAENTRRFFARRTHCPHGHPWSEENTWLSKGLHRQCKTCHRERERARKEARRGH